MKVLPARTILQNRYVIIRQIGQGGMGAVYQAQDRRLGHSVAVKQTLIGGRPFREAFEREARILAGLNHPSLPNVTDNFIENGCQFLVMQYIEGDDLDQLLRRRGSPFALEQVLAWADQLLDVLEYLHSRNPPVIHRDIKPSNIKLTPEGQVVLLDFGLSKGGNAYWRTVGRGRSVQAFTPHYASLEQIRGKGTDQRSDLYSVGATLYRLLTGIKLPNASTRAQSQLSEQPDPLPLANHVNPNIPSWVADVLQRAMSLNAQERPQSAAQLRDALRSAPSRPDINSPWEQILRQNGAATPVSPSPSRPRPQSQPVISRPGSRSGSRPGSRPGSGSGSRPGSRSGSRLGSRPSSGSGPGSGPGSRPSSGSRSGARPGSRPSSGSGTGWQRPSASPFADFTWQQWAIASLTGVLLLVAIAFLLIPANDPSSGNAAATSEPPVVINTQVSETQLSTAEIPTDPISPEATATLVSDGSQANPDNQESPSEDQVSPEPTSTLLVGLNNTNNQNNQPNQPSTPNNNNQNNQNNSPTETLNQNNNNGPATEQAQQEALQATQQAQQEALQATQQAQEALQVTQEAQQVQEALQATQQAQEALQATQQAQQALQATQQANAVATAEAAGNAQAEANAQATQNAINAQATQDAINAQATQDAINTQANATLTAHAAEAYAQATADAELAYAQATADAEQASIEATQAAAQAAAQATEYARQQATVYAQQTQQARQAASQATQQAQANAQATRRAQQTQIASMQATQQARSAQATAFARAQINLVPISLIGPPSKSSYSADETINFQWSWQGSLAGGRAPRYRINVLKFGNLELFMDSDETSFLWYHQLNPEEYTWYVIVLDENGQEIPQTRSGENSFWIVTR